MNEQVYAGFFAELNKLAASSERLTVPKSRSGRRPLSVTTLLAKDKAGTLHKKSEASWHDQLPGGLADKKKPSDFSAASLRQERKVESEHTKDRTLPTEIAMDHLTEDPRYYDKLRVMEKSSGLGKVAFKLQGHMKFQGIPIAIENRKGSTREGVDPDGKPWKTTFAYPYGYIKKTEGKDGEEIDVYVGPQKDASDVFVVHQRKIDGTGHDEDKLFLGFPSVESVRKAYLDHYNKVGPKLLGEISTISVDLLKKKLEESRKHTKLAVAQANPNSVSGTRKGDVPSRDGNASVAGKIEEQGLSNLPLDITTTVVR